ncbi:biotin--[acetyl-CoA-carboxylase] ligase [uncultured Clostridium sp.]|uniref:biotin--[acetyl-CoA-carboxylase] ligase n=1 Tax=uncultured Clostridium sp. TaxID=59620 RepID=UPI0025878792|nr:biotin--[acetyl-CoA-carboxylase] ligase [uncultured Clostridium sp.]MDU1348012.1 biotin--[acetyl-CoA-carboxylase] ligase [Clostridium argentinense]
MKSKILKILKDNKEEFISGENLSKNFGITRAGIWKYMNALKEEGYEIASISKKGYKLISSPDILKYEEIEEYLETQYIGRNIIHYNTIDSTNKVAKSLAMESKEGTVIVSEEQTNGRGRLGRNWRSPSRAGIWMSIILKPNISPMMASKVTLIGAAAVHKALEEIGIIAKIKWPNDILLNNKKICGILTEMSGEMDKLNYIVMGIGINVNVEEFPDELKIIATSLKIEENKQINRKELFSKILNNFESLYDEFKNNGNIISTIDICRKNSLLLGKEVSLINGSKVVTAKALDLDEDGELLVEYEDKTKGKVISGEVSVRGLYGYV